MSNYIFMNILSLNFYNKVPLITG